MSRSGYTDDFCDDIGALNRYRANVDRALAGKRGQSFLREMAAALDALPKKELIAHELVAEDGVCAIGSVALARGMDVSSVDESEPDAVAAAFGIARCMAAEIAYENDESGAPTNEQRWRMMREWVAQKLRP